jgi:hypothetical protein
MLLVAPTVAAADVLGASGAVVFINIPLGGDATTRGQPSLGFDVDMPGNHYQRAPLTAARRRSISVAPFEIEMTHRGNYRFKVGGIYLDSLN